MKVSKRIKCLIASSYAFIFHKRKLETISCDILFLYHCSIDIERTKRLIAALEERNKFCICCEMLPSTYKIVLDRLFVKTKRIAPFSYCFIEYYAAYLVKKYQPKILLTFEHGSVFSFFLKKEMESIGGKGINIAHGMMLNAKLTIFDFHYYFMFGQYSVDGALQQKTRYGSTKLVKSGSFLMDEEFTLPVNKEFKKLLFFSSWLKKGNKNLFLGNFNLLAKWAKVNLKYHLVIKHHPLEDESIIRSIFKGIPDVTFLPKDTRMKDALRDISLILTSGSTSALEAALLNRPAVVISGSDEPYHYAIYHELEKYFLPGARNVEEIQDRIEETFARYDYFLKKSKEFVHRHLEHTTDSISFIAHCIKSICDGKEDFEYIPIEGEGTEDPFLRDW